MMGSPSASRRLAAIMSGVQPDPSCSSRKYSFISSLLEKGWWLPQRQDRSSSGILVTPRQEIDCMTRPSELEDGHHRLSFLRAWG